MFSKQTCKCNFLENGVDLINRYIRTLINKITVDHNTI